MRRTGIILPFYNDARYIDEMLSSIDHPCEVVIVNDCTPYQDARLKLAQLTREGCTILHQKYNRGCAAALNRGIDYLLENTPVDYLIACASDDAFPRWWLATAEDVMEQNPHIHLLTGYCSILQTGQRLFAPQGNFTLDFNDTATGGTLIRRRVFDKLRFDEEIVAYEDWDFYNRCILEGFNITAVNQEAYLWRRKLNEESLSAKGDAMRSTLIAYMHAKYQMKYPAMRKAAY